MHVASCAAQEVQLCTLAAVTADTWLMGSDAEHSRGKLGIINELPIDSRQTSVRFYFLVLSYDAE